MAQAMAEIKNSWLPEVYTNFLETSSHLQRWRIPHLTVLVTSTIAGGVAFFNPEYANYLFQPQVLLTETLAYIAVYPHANLPNFNVRGRRLHRQLYEQALNISQTEGFSQKGSKNKIINTVKGILSYTSILAPVNNSFDPRLAPSERFKFFPTSEEELDKLSHTDMQVLRKALILAEPYWQRLGGYKAEEVLEGIKAHMAMLSSVGRQF